jgi:hypothetical protein
VLKTLLDFSPNETVTLIPNSGVQFMDFGFRAEAMPRSGRSVTAVRTGTADEVVIYPVHTDEDGEGVHYRERPSGQRRPVDEDATYTIKPDTALTRLNNMWLPFPFFRRAVKGFDEGPTTWARIKVVALACRVSPTPPLKKIPTPPNV